MPSSILDAIAVEARTDKSSLVHDYCKKYEKIISFAREDKIRMLEIGVLNGASLKMWKNYFINAEIVALDINPICKVYEEDRVTIEIGNQSDPNFLKRIGEKYKEFDFIIDDGSHIQNDVITSFEHLFPFLKPSCLYIVEDVVTSYWASHGGGLKQKDSMVEYFKSLIDDVNYHGISSKLITEGVLQPHGRKDKELILAAKKYNEKIPKPIKLDIEALMFYNSFIVIKKHNKELVQIISSHK